MGAMTEREMVLQQIAEMQAQLAGQSAGSGAQANTPAVAGVPSEATHGSAPGAQLTMSRQGSLRNRITELQAQLARHDAQDPNLKSAETKTSDAEYGGPAYAVQANPAYTQGLVGAAPGVPRQGPVVAGPGYPQQGGAPTGYANQTNFSGDATDARSWVDAILFLLGFVLGIPWLVGACLPLCRRPRFRSSFNLGFWIGNLIMTIATIVAIIVLIVVFVKVVDATAGVENNYQNQDFGK